jgi:hypothetical protein
VPKVFDHARESGAVLGLGHWEEHRASVCGATGRQMAAGSSSGITASGRGHHAQ